MTDWSNSKWGYADSNDEPEQGEEDLDREERRRRREARRIVVHPEPEEFTTPAQRMSKSSKKNKNPPDIKPAVDLRKDYGKLQIIVKLANIYLTPEKPDYEGGTWHVEGQANESM